jgi:hypothetical protein
MRLVPLTGKPKRSSTAPEAQTTAPGFMNRNGQTVVERTGFPSTTFPRQLIYRLKCRACSQEYGSNGCDIHARRCPHCQSGSPGEPLREKPAYLFG